MKIGMKRRHFLTLVVTLPISFFAKGEPMTPPLEDIRANIDPVGVELGSDVGVECVEPDPHRVASVLTEIDDDPNPPVIFTEAGVTYVHLTYKTVELYPEEGRFIVRDIRGYDGPEERIELAPEEWLERSTPLLEALGVDVNEGRYRVVELGTEATIDEEGDKEDVEGNVELVAFKMFLQRGLNDIPVPANRAVVSFATDGHLRKVLGTWNCIVADESVFEVDADLDEVLDRMAMGVAETITEYELEVRMEPMPAWTFYDLDDLGGGQFRARLRGQVMVSVDNPEGDVKPVILDVDL